jgi:hypothetical protein
VTKWQHCKLRAERRAGELLKEMAERGECRAMVEDGALLTPGQRLSHLI